MYPVHKSDVAEVHMLDEDWEAGAGNLTRAYVPRHYQELITEARHQAWHLINSTCNQSSKRQGSKAGANGTTDSLKREDCENVHELQGIKKKLS